MDQDPACKGLTHFARGARIADRSGGALRRGGQVRGLRAGAIGASLYEEATAHNVRSWRHCRRSYFRSGWRFWVGSCL